MCDTVEDCKEIFVGNCIGCPFAVTHRFVDVFPGNGHVSFHCMTRGNALKMFRRDPRSPSAKRMFMALFSKAATGKGRIIPWLTGVGYVYSEGRP